LSKILGNGGTEEITALSKHSNQRKYRYVTELPPTSLMVMAGFKKDDDFYYVPRTTLDFGTHTLIEIILCFFPDWQLWIEQQSSKYGCQTVAAKNFLYETIPFAATVLWQDGIYWFKEYPLHRWSIFLRQVLPPDYEMWALQARRRCKELETRYQELQSIAGEKGRQAALLDLCSKVSALDTKLDSALAGIHKLEQDHKASLDSLKDNFTTTLQSGNLQLKRELIGRFTNACLLTDTHADSIFEREENVEEAQDSLLPSNPVNTQSYTHSRSNAPASNILRNTALIPMNITKLPTSIVQLLREHQALISFHDTPKTDWPHNIQIAFSKRKYIYSIIRSRSRHIHLSNIGDSENSMEKAARSMDFERGSLTINKYLRLLKSSDPHVRKRKRDDEL